ncbi:alpha/beta fold hydrolase [Phreatobacter cathodiphilus]|uniref:Alpha/beta hydrolase n=1 Tax=Phreatobacter cathodiphilus TaxID=1868589 RepID=A0A2S0NB17_9HYPH|nr:alpha/beta hydrolase [Phreatobacter cathodiphilus]AVO45364.1 alpha/beta hydrolase [Phreatobacter cathodiphilus]
MIASTSRLPKHSFSSDGVEIAYFDTGEGDPVLCIHGFASTAHINWTYPGWVDTLTKAGRRVIALDNRGHGDSEKLYDPAAYHTTLMAEDARALLDHLAIAKATVLGYSMGSRITAFLAHRHPDRVKAAIMGGLGIKLIDGVGLPETIAEALEAPTLEEVTDPQGRMFRAFAMQTKSDRRALAACIRGSRNLMSREEAASIACPVLIAVGTKDAIAGAPEPLAAIIPKGEALSIPDRDHMPAVGDKVFKAGALDFLARHAA